MNVQNLSRAALDGYLKLLRLPANAVLGVVGGRSEGKRGTPEIVLDRAEAAVREAAGRVLHDPQLQDDARRRRAAADERERALTLRAEAANRSRHADEELVARQEAADQRRRDAAQQAEEKKEAARARRDETSVRLADAEQRGRTVVRAQKEHTEDAIEDSARHRRLEQLSTETQTLDEEEKALTARSEAQRLRRAASETKAKRKAGNG